MAQGQGQGVRGVVGPGDGFQVQQAAGHVHHLALFCLAVAHHRHLHLGGGVLVERDPALFRRVQQHAAGVGHGDAGGQVRVEEQLLDGDDIRLQLADQVLHIGADLVQPPGERQPRRGGDGAVGKHVHLCPLRRDEAEADGGVAGVDAQDPHGAFPPVYIL